MRYLLSIISFFFSGIFYLFIDVFGHPSLFSRFSLGISLESLFFALFGVFSLFYFVKYSGGEKEYDRTSELSLKTYYIHGRDFFRNYMYYIGFLLFYASVYILLASKNIFSFSVFILMVNSIIGVGFFISHRFFIFRDFIKINTILFSVYYLLYFLFYLFSPGAFFSPIDTINSVLLFFFFLIHMYEDKVIHKRDMVDVTLVGYFFVYAFFFLSVYTSSLFLSLPMTFGVVSFGLHLLLFYLLPKIPMFVGGKILFRYLGLLASYIAFISFGYILWIFGVSLIPVLIILYLSLLNIYIHYKYENYISLFLGVLGCSYVYFFFLLGFFTISLESFLIYGFSFATFLVLMTYIYHSPHSSTDTYVLHFFSYLVNIFTMTYYFWITQFELFTFGAILLFNSLYVFFSYYKLKNL